MWLFSVVIFMLAISHCISQDDYEDLLLIATSDTCELNSIEVDEEGVCVKASQCRGRTLEASTPPPETHFQLRALPGNAAELLSSECKLGQVCCPKANVVVESKAKTPLRQGCGYSNFDDIVKTKKKADYAAYAEFPWMVALMLKKDIPNKTFVDEYIGGGTLIHPSVVMTVAHKVSKTESKELKCRAGEWNWSINDEPNKRQERDVAEIIINENFNVKIYYDMALLILSSPFNLENAPHIGTGCLEPKLPSPGTVCYGMGWGKDLTNNKKNSDVLKKLELPLVQSGECENKLRTTRFGSHYKLHKTKMCAGGEAGVDTCDDDGGSPLVCRILDPKGVRYSVVGMVAYGDDCGKPIPSVYVNVPQLYDWVTKQMTTRNFNTTFFTYHI